MSLLDEAKQAAIVRGPSCGFGAWLATLEPKQQAEVNELILANGPTGTIIVDVLTKHFGALPFRAETVIRHRRSVRDGRTGCLCRVL